MLDHPPGLQLTFSGIGGVRQLTFEEDSLVLEARDNVTGMLQPEEEIFWEEVQAVYLWKGPDWLGLASTALPGLFLVLLVGGIFAASQSEELGWIPPLIGLLAVALVAFVTLRMRPRRYVRVVSSDREIRFHTTEKQYIRTLLHRLNVPLPPDYEVG